ncbi:MAG TPA: hypothetical protein ENF63_00565 [Candidatus Bathyarchaeota archaeon]|nr:hypothetical protein [Candidatus Bathyarchaeota archaeon]
MRILVLGGAGAMGMVTVRDLAEAPEVSEVIIGDINVEKAEEVAEWAGKEKISIRKVDVSSIEDLASVMKDADAVANAAPYHLNLAVTKAAIKAGKNLTDLGGVYYMTLKQLELDNEAKNAGITIVLDCGLAPGVADILAKHGADKLDKVEEVHIWYGDRSFEPAKYKWSFRTVLEEYTKGPVIYEDGEFKRLPPFSGKQLVKFPAPVGERPCCYALYSGLATLPQTIGKGVRKVDCSMSYTQEDELRIKVLNELGLTSDKPIKIGGVQISPREFLLRCVPPPDVRAKDASSLIVEVKGEKDEFPMRIRYSLVQQFHEKYGVSAIAYLTGVPLSIVSQILAKDEIKERGVLPPEIAVPHKTFFKELAKRGITISEAIEKTSKLV